MSVESNKNWVSFQESLPNFLRGGEDASLTQEDIKNWLVRWLQIHRSSDKPSTEAEVCLRRVADRVVTMISPNDGDAVAKILTIPNKDKLHVLCRELLLLLDEFQIYKKFNFSKEEF